MCFKVNKILRNASFRRLTLFTFWCKIQIRIRRERSILVDPIMKVAHNLQPANSYNCTQLEPKTASVVPPEDGRLATETCGGLRHNKVFVKVKVY
jgi:hypothetical protein